MPGSKREVKNAREEGVDFQFNLQPLSIELNSAGRVAGVKMVRTQLGAPDANGRQAAEQVPGSEHVIDADAVVMAFGFRPHRMDWLAAHDVQLDKQGRIHGAGRQRQRVPDQQPENLRRRRRGARFRPRW